MLIGMKLILQSEIRPFMDIFHFNNLYPIFDVQRIFLYIVNLRQRFVISPKHRLQSGISADENSPYYR